MAEVQTQENSGEHAQRFIEFVMMHAQQAAFYLGQIPNPQTGEAEVHLDAAKMFIDQLAMLRAKTRGNLNADEIAVLNNAISNLQMAFFEVAQKEGGATPATPPPASEPAPAAPAESEVKAEVPAAAVPEAPAVTESESKKKFTKSYGA